MSTLNPDEFDGGLHGYEQCTIDVRHLHDLLDHLKKGLEPAIPFDLDNNKMLARAYEVRGDVLSYVLSRINTFLMLS